MRVGILGGTGPAGRALAARLASVGFNVVVGSRSAAKAKEITEQLSERWPGRELTLEPGENIDAARADVVVVATPWDAAADTAASVAGELQDKVVISMANALEKGEHGFQPITPRLGSIAAQVQEAVPNAFVAAAFQHLPARSLGDLDSTLDGDVLVCSDHEAAETAASELVNAIPNLRAINGGPLASAAPVEAFTAVLVGVNQRYKARAIVKLTGIPR